MKILFLMNSIAFNNSIIYGSFIDPRDGSEYRTVNIGDELWMAENLKYSIPESWFYNNSLEYSIYGRLYTFESARIACPPGWNLPTINQYKQLCMDIINQNYSSYPSGLMLRRCNELCEASTNHWKIIPINQFTNISGFTALPAGMRDSMGFFKYIHKIALFWTNTECNVSDGFAYRIQPLNPYFNDNMMMILKQYGCSVRCVLT